ncbi:aldo/keto reductase [Paraburkholderia caballeronis]|uniref:Predicted oxidoreductase n=1 Tax=Paraburkholderia caballeronis TaxID=416943 RepID=A0A1H7JEK6_9BURK|nr:aldo/keto reductase [Paraburkholderia caballeronis]PXW27496.1 aryl-alcohol dehydrogenase-like predicted oxidoreductase [Paraburkholderia caballeronis]PXX02970.1 aryl-alcohol dehydrogenase-like predicted oxidoreductase [Paraburkholderia caballeronis]RAK03695.1 aryl-alcohol dehydrogenase-like predicted oxidoreductase [Paraburkholderia caballeronis]TDV06124.1 aryl-alcohol dehydrogenase-like predicted oxidoreductase [Paraburkholderia caballeronis]TDV09664.1 aryl-alcohol dehydrogenase-like predi
MRYRLFGKHTGLRVSELVLGAGSFGTRWGHGAEPDEARRIFDAYADAGGNFIDTANGYQFGQSEEILGELLAGRRDEFVLATKFTMRTDNTSGLLVTGNSRKAMVASVEASLKRLKTDRIDLYWAHVSDGVTPVEEIVRGFDDLVRAGKILYAGLSDFPAWRVARAATIAELRGAAPIAGLQVEHSLVERSTEQELLPAGHALGLGVVAWSPLGGGMLTGKYRHGEKGRAEGFGGRVFQAENSPQRTAVLDTLIAIAQDAGVTPGEIAIAWVAAKGSLPIIGPRTLAQLENNLAAANVTLSPQQIARLDEVSAIPFGFPYTVINDPETRQLYTGGKADQFDAPSRIVA